MEKEFDPYLGADGVSFGERDAALLRAIDEYGSMHRAAAETGRSYAHLQRRIVEVEEAFGPLVERQRGGSGGGGSRLTRNARRLLGRFERLRTAITGVVAVEETVVSGTVADRDGELGIVDTGAGRIRALVPPDATDVQVTVCSDAVTLTAPETTPGPDETSARNRFRGTVREVETGETVASVGIDAGAETTLVALVTRASVEKLDLAPGSEVVASFKATATRAVPSEPR